MPNLKVKDNVSIYYEVHGKGEPVLVLNGIMMNTMSWLNFIPLVSDYLNLVLMDFRDQGRSSRMQEQYTQDIHIGDIIELLDELEIPKIHLVGLSYGGQVALKFALKHQNRLKTLILPNVPNFITNHLQEIGRGWETAAELKDGEKFFQLAIPYIYSATFYQDNIEFLRERQKMFKTLLTDEWFEGLVRLSRSTSNYYISPDQLKTIKVPSLLMWSEEDMVVARDATREIHENIEDCEFIVVPNAGHAAFLERMKEFLTIITGFIYKHSKKQY